MAEKMVLVRVHIWSFDKASTGMGQEITKSVLESAEKGEGEEIESVLSQFQLVQEHVCMFNFM